MNLAPRNQKGTNRTQIWTTIQLVYDNVHAALWASLCVGVLYFLFFIAPSLPAARTQYAMQQDQAISAESRHYCQKWGMPTGTHRHFVCILDLQTIRSNVYRRDSADALF